MQNFYSAVFIFPPWSLSKLLHCYLANVNWGMLQFPPKSTCCACFEEDFQNTASDPSNTKANEPLQNTGPSLLKKAGEAAPITSHQPTYAFTERGNFLQGLHMRMQSSTLSTQPCGHFLDAVGFSPLSHWHARKENLADSRKSPDSRTLQTDSCLFPCL